MTEVSDETLDVYITTIAAALGLAVEPAWQESVRANLKTTLRFADLVAVFELPDDAEPAPVFEA